MAETPTVISAETREERKRHHFLVELLIRLVREKPLGVVGGVIVLVLLFTGIFANALALYGFNDIYLAERLLPPSGAHILGTDNLGRDLLSRIIYGARISMFVGLGVALIEITLNTLIGMVSGYLGGKVDLIIQRFVDAWMCFPRLVLLLTIMTIVGPGIVQVIFVLGIVGGLGGATRVKRSAVIGIKENLYFEAARAIGTPATRIIMRHVLPNIMPVIIITFTMNVGQAIISEATLSFLGFGIPPPVPSWGGMLSGPGRQFMLLAPWMVMWPGLAALSQTAIGDC
ncbi:MAG: ABC transporter permease [Chloroflexi bacterium]|nr:ABC transporter permease [Chloroflexota bacterium]